MFNRRGPKANLSKEHYICSEASAPRITLRPCCVRGALETPPLCSWVVPVGQFAFHPSVLKRSSHDCGLLVFCRFMMFTRHSRSSCPDPIVCPQLRTSSTADSIGVEGGGGGWGVECKKSKRKKKTITKKRKSLFFYLPFGEMHCSDMNKETRSPGVLNNV